MRHKSWKIRGILFLLALPCGMYASGPVELQLLAHVNDHASAGYNDCWGYTAPDGREYALLGVQNGLSIVDITDAPTTNEVAFIPSTTSLWQDIKTYRQYAYTVNESGGGMHIVDLSDLPNSATLVGTYSGFTTSHNIYIDTTRALLFAEGTSSEPVRILTLADPVNPVELTTFGLECHDMMSYGDTVFVAEGNSGSIGIFDVSNPSSPVLIHRHNIPSPGYVHNVWVSEDGQRMMTTEETVGKTVKMWDISDLGNITLLDEYLSAPSLIAHNVFLKENYAYLSHYEDGVRVLDISNPGDIFEVGYYNTWNNSGLGCWGTYPFFESGKIIGSDVETGLWVLFFEGAIGGNQFDPKAPTGMVAYSDYTTPTGMLITWTDPTQLVNGTPIQPEDFVVEVERDGLNIGSSPGGTGQFTDSGLTDGQSYTYTIYARLIANDSTSQSVSASWIAGGSPVPSPPEEFVVSGDATMVSLHWTNASTNDDGTPLDDLAGVDLYQDSLLVATFTRLPGAAGQADSAEFVPGTPGEYTWYVTTVDNEIPQHESVPSGVSFTPLSVPFEDSFASPGPPDPRFWVNQNGDVNDRASNPPSVPFSLNLNGHPDGGDIVDLHAFDLTGMEGSGITFSFSYQPQGTGNAPESGDSLTVFFKNSAGEWIKVRSYGGGSVVPFVGVTVDIAAQPSGNGTFFFPQFQARFRSIGTADPVTIFDDWFVDDVSLSIPTSVQPGSGAVPATFALLQNYPNPFNPATSIRFDVPAAANVRLTVYDLLGEKIRTLVDGRLDGGSHSVVWDGMNDTGTAVVSGVYFYRLESADFVSTRKMILMK